MKDVITILRRFVPKYKRFMAMHVIFITLSNVLGLFSFAMLMPVLGILFQTQKAVTTLYTFDMVQNHTINIKAFVENQMNYYTTHIINTYGADNALLVIGLFLIIMTMLKVGFAYLAAYSLVPLRTGVSRDLRNMVFRKITILPLGFFTTERKGDVMSRMTNDVQEIENSVISSLDVLFKDPITIFVNLVAMFIMSWQLTLFVLTILPISGFIIGRIGRSLKKPSTSAQIQLGVLLSQIEETLTGLRIVKAFNAEAKVVNRFGKANELHRKFNHRIMRKRLLAHPMSELMGTLVIVIVLWYGGKLIIKGEGFLTGEAFIYYIVLFYSIINPAKSFTTGLYSVQKGMASIDRVDGLLNTENPIVESPDAIPVKQFAEKIEVRDLWFRYKDVDVLKNVSLDIEKGTTVALVGQSGSGKSTLVDLIPRFYDIIKGSIKIDGIEIKDIKIADLRHLMGNVNQEPLLFNDSFYNNITFGVEHASMDEVISAAKVANAHDFIVATAEGYDTMIGDRGSRLSGGQRQRISIARAILANPPILILDEATSALDTESEKLVQDAIEKLMKNRTTIVIAHRLSTVRNADMICVLHEGEIVERGHHDELLALGGVYHKLHSLQTK